MSNYYQTELSKVKPELTPYFPTIKIFANGNGEDTKNITLNEESSKELIFWLANNFLNDKSLEDTIRRIKLLAGEKVINV